MLFEAAMANPAGESNGEFLRLISTGGSWFGVVTLAQNRRFSSQLWLGDERPKALIIRHAGCERPALLTSKTNERDNA